MRFSTGMLAPGTARASVRVRPACETVGHTSWSAWVLPDRVEYLDLEDLLSLVPVLGVGPVRDVGLLDSAAARPRSSTFGRDAYPTLALKAGALLDSIVRLHALGDGNKRLGWLATVVFLDLNGHAPDLTDDAAFDLVMDFATSRLEVAVVAERLRVTPR